MSSRKVYRILLGFVIGVGGQPAWAVDLAASPQAPISTAAKPRIAQTAQPAAKPVSMQVGSAAPGALPGASPSTLWQFMGIPQGIRKWQGATRNRNGNRPNREPTPPMKAIADPANLDPGNGPAINKAAEIKQKEDLAPQKIKALKYLATIGCGCYPGVEEAFAKSLKFGDECTEEVRYEAAQAIQEAAESNCAKCGKSCCCTAEMMQLLNDVATGRDADGCFLEPSARVRAAACEALLACRRRVPVYPAPPAEPYVPPETPGETIPREPLPGEFVPKESSASTGRVRRPNDGNTLMNDILGGEQGGQSSASDGGIAASPVSNRKSASQDGSGDASRPAPTRAMLVGSIVGVDARTGTVDLEFQGNRQPTVGSQFSVHHEYALSTVYQGRIEVVYLARNGRAIAKPVGRVDFTKLGKGDRVTGRITAGDDESATSPASHTTRGSSRSSCVAPPEGNAIPQPPAESPGNATTSAPSRPTNVTQKNAVPAKSANSAKKLTDLAPRSKSAIAKESNIGKQALDIVNQPKNEPAAKEARSPKSLADALAPWKKPQPDKAADAGKQQVTAVGQPSKPLSPIAINSPSAKATASNNPWRSAVPAKPMDASRQFATSTIQPSATPPTGLPAGILPTTAKTTKRPASLSAPKVGVGFDEEAPSWSNSFFKRKKPAKQTTDKTAAAKSAPASKVAKPQPFVGAYKPASQISSAWSKLTKPESARINPSSVAPAAASSDGRQSPVAGIVLMEE